MPQEYYLGYFNVIMLFSFFGVFSGYHHLFFPLHLFPSLPSACKFWVVLSACRKTYSRNISTLLPFCQCSVQIEEHIKFVCHGFSEVCLFFTRSVTPVIQAQDFTCSSIYVFQVGVLGEENYYVFFFPILWAFRGRMWQCPLTTAVNFHESDKAIWMLS